MEEKSVVAVLRRRDAILEALELVVCGIEAVAPRLGRERRIGDDKIERLEAAVGLLEVRAGKRVVLARFPPWGSRAESCSSAPTRWWRCPFPARRGRGRGRCGLGFVVRLQQQRAGAAGRVVDRLVGAFRAADSDDLRHDARDFRRRVELALALARLGGEVAHQVFVGVAEQVVALGAVARGSRAPACRRSPPDWRGGPPSPCPCRACPRR